MRGESEICFESLEPEESVEGVSGVGWGVLHTSGPSAGVNQKEADGVGGACSPSSPSLSGSFLNLTAGISLSSHADTPEAGAHISSNAGRGNQ